MFLAICDNPSILKIVQLIKIVVVGIQIVVPIILIINISLDFAKGVKDATAPSKILEICKYRIIAAIVIFAVPLLVSILLKIVGESTIISSCWNNATSANIAAAQEKYEEEEQKRLEEEKKRQEELKEQQKEQEKQNEIDKTYTDSNSHTNSINGIKYMIYDQTDSRWGNTKYPNGKTIGAIGCLITSTAVISSSADSSITPLSVFNTSARHEYPSNGVITMTGNDYFTCKWGSITRETIVNDLLSGKVGVIKVEEGSRFTSSQHYMALIDVSSDGNKIFIGNYYSGGSGGWYATSTVLTDVHEYFICTPSQKLIDKFN